MKERIKTGLINLLMSSMIGIIFFQPKVSALETVPVSFPVVFGAKNDGYPDEIKIQGIIKEISFGDVRNAECGARSSWEGTFRVGLTNKIKKYPKDNVFVVMSCFRDTGNESKYLDRVVDLEVHKLMSAYDFNKSRGKKRPCYFADINNTLNSKGVPFYCTSLGQDALVGIGTRVQRK